MEPGSRVAYLLAETRRVDPACYLCALFAPAGRREAVLALTLLNHELERVPAIVSQPMAGLIRYQWWRDAVEEAMAGRTREQPVVEALAEGLGQGWLDAAGLLAMIEAREVEIEGGVPPGLAAAEAHLARTLGGLQAMVLDCLGEADAGQRRAATLLGTAHGLTRLASAGEGALERATALLAEARRLAPRPPRPLMPGFLLGRFVRRHAQSGPAVVLDLVLASLRRRY